MFNIIKYLINFPFIFSSRNSFCIRFYSHERNGLIFTSISISFIRSENNTNSRYRKTIERRHTRSIFTNSNHLYTNFINMTKEETIRKSHLMVKFKTSCTTSTTYATTRTFNSWYISCFRSCYIISSFCHNF
ncbi:MAG: hypothetical protein KNU04_gp62 [crAssphage sp. isolate ctbg_1]|uniref:Uncharacterized protein n=1 Tax=crAssphage sp. isolate ctbg_1 TaxID=2989854 RepID=A0A345MT07_9CAUD|nr:MAG: hypothetical protein KNU04_gp62 [crAssphage sp. isolate ctbg_1]AXH74507.1 MAG: hypothetical protein [crAssphage sp. isolate ctbg_1]